MGSTARNELLRITKRHQKRVMALILRLQSMPSPTLMTRSTSSSSEINSIGDRSTSKAPPNRIETSSITPLSLSGPSAVTEAPYQIQLALNALSYLASQLEYEQDDPSSSAISDATGSGTGTAIAMEMTPDDIAKLKTCAQALLTAAYFCLYMATKMSCSSEESSWIGSGLSRAGSSHNSFMEHDWAHGRLYYEAHYIFRLGLDDQLSFMKANASTSKLLATFEKPFKELKIEGENYRVK